MIYCYASSRTIKYFCLIQYGFSRLIAIGVMYMGVTVPEMGKRTMLRFVVMNSSITEQDIVYLLNKIDQVGQNLVV
jgi:hypothetical protein